mmetsp:Transcript_4072/g.14391  ORF Transcript_4072/g.14391 Transcript_4072/m.14391 type:complete len:863 (+) Transcript_4072:79-2667(+)
MAEESGKPIAGKWEDPAEENGKAHSVGLMMYNSITDSKVEFVPAEGRKVSWYICGPTVYDSSHIGHARNYVSFDVLRRVVSDYFGYNVTYAMNITDLDDKIIIRTHFNRLRRLYETANGLAASLPAEAKEELANAKKHINANLKDIVELERTATALVSAVTVTLEDEEAARAAGASDAFVTEFYGQFDIQEAYLELAKFYEKDFFEDMDLLNVRRPDVVTRVSEYVSEIVQYVEKIIDNGFAYPANGSVYFDMKAFTEAGFGYRKTSPHIDASEVAALLRDGEGDLAAELGKKRQQDFALWKALKPGEPVWPSPWGEGRPGWHIECSAMASNILGEKVDINCGGVDLRFPHHDNQLAQSEAHYGCKQWVNYFLHTGHLHINGLKMSKSLKNFITIKKSLEVYTARQMRLLFLTHKYSSPLEIDLVGGAKESGVLKVTKAVYSPGNVDATAEFSALVSGSLLSLATDIALPKAVGAKELRLEATVDGQATIHVVKVAGGHLAEALQLRAGGRIEQMEAVVTIEKVFSDFFSNVRLLLRTQPDQVTMDQKWNDEDRELNAMLDKTVDDVHAALLDSVNTARAMELLQMLAKTSVGYISRDPSQAKALLLQKVAQYVTRMWRIFGLLSSDVDEFGLPWESSTPVAVEAPVAAVLDRFCAFRDAARDAARSKAKVADVAALCDRAAAEMPGLVEHPANRIRAVYAAFVEEIRTAAKQGPKALFAACDQVRDEKVAPYGVRLEDDIFGKAGVSSWKLDDVRFTMADREARTADSLHAQEAKRKAAEAKQKAAAEKAKLEAKVLSIPPEEYFKKAEKHTGAFSQFDDAGIPTHDAEGKQLPTSRVKKLKKEHAVHVRKHQAFLKQNGK